MRPTREITKFRSSVSVAFDEGVRVNITAGGGGVAGLEDDGHAEALMALAREIAGLPDYAEERARVSAEIADLRTALAAAEERSTLRLADLRAVLNVDRPRVRGDVFAREVDGAVWLGAEHEWTRHFAYVFSDWTALRSELPELAPVGAVVDPDGTVAVRLRVVEIKARGGA